MRPAKHSIAIIATAALCGTVSAVDRHVPTPYPTIQAAITACAPSGDRVIVAEGTYTERINFEGKDVEVRSTDPLDSTVVENTIINGTGGPIVTCVLVETRHAILNGLTISGGSAPNGGGMLIDNSADPTVVNCVFESNTATGSNGYGGAIVVLRGSTLCTPLIEDCTFRSNSADKGGAIYSDESHPDIVGCIFETNTADSTGGAVYIGRRDGVSLTDCTFTGNTASSGGGMHLYNANTTLTTCTFTSNQGAGGGMYNENSNATITSCTFNTNAGGNGGAIHNLSSAPTITGTSFTGNTASSGGAIYGQAGSPVVAINCTFTDNDAQESGGAVYNQNNNASYTACTFTHNRADLGGSSVGGGAIYHRDAATLTLDDCLFELNEAINNGDGGTLAVSMSGLAMVTRCRFVGNKATGDNGGGLYAQWVADVTLENCVFRDNTAMRGAAISTDNADTSVVLRNCTVGTNSATSSGGGIYVEGGSVTAYNSILCANDPDQVVDLPASSEIYFSDVQDGWGGTGGNNINQDPRFNDEAGGDLTLDRFSPCIDAGDNGQAPVSIMDLDGNPRYYDDAGVANTGSGSPPIDMGAYERQVDSENIGFAVNSGMFIQDAIDDTLDGDWVDVGPGTYEEVISFNGKAITVQSTDGFLTTHIWGNGVGPVVTFDNDEGSESILDGFFVYGGVAVSGGGIYIENASPKVRNCTIVGSANQGGGIYTAGGNPKINNSVVSSSNAMTGGGMYVASGSPSLTGTTFELNTATGSGGGIHSETPGSLTLTNVTFDQNTAVGGGGLWSQNGDGAFTGCTFTANDSGGGDGGGMMLYQTAHTLTECTFDGNVAGTRGGGMYAFEQNEWMDRCVFTANDANQGGGVTLEWSSPVMTNCLFDRNTSTLDGGGMYVLYDQPQVINCTFSQNDGGAAGGAIMMAMGAGPYVQNSILWGDTPDEVYFGYPIEAPQFSYSDIAGSGGSGPLWAFDPDTDAGGNIDLDPLFMDADGIDPEDHHLGVGSPAIDAGDSYLVPTGINDDLDGALRIRNAPASPDTGQPLGAVVDVGVYEIQPPCPEDLSGSGSVDFADILIVIGDWGCTGPCPGDVDGNGSTGFSDVLAIIAEWGDC